MERVIVSAMEKNNSTASFFTKASSSVNQGLREYMLGVYNNMAFALGLSAFVAFFAARSGLSLIIFKSPLGVLVSISPIFISLYLASRFNSMTVSAVRNVFWLYSVVMGLSLSTLFFVFKFTEIANAFLSTAGMFAGMSIYGYSTKKDLSVFASTAVMVLWGLVIASLINMFAGGSGFSFLISAVSVCVFAFMVAFDTQNLRRVYYSHSVSSADSRKIAIFGAMQLYIDFVAIFVHLLRISRFLGSRDE